MKDLLDRHALCQQIVDLAPDAILAADRQGTIRYWNAGAETIFGYTATEALGQSLDLIIPEKLRERHWQGYHQTMLSGQSRYGAKLLSVPALCRNGRQVSSEFCIVLLRNESEEVLGVAAIMRDASEAWTREKVLKERLASLEKKREG
jgi:PAS domain S-box-containing protein